MAKPTPNLKVQGQRAGGESALAAACLSYLDLKESLLFMADFYGANLERSRLGSAHYANVMDANLRHTEFDDDLVRSLSASRHAPSGHRTPELLTWNSTPFGKTDFRGSNIEQLVARDRKSEKALRPASKRPRQTPGP